MGHGWLPSCHCLWVSKSLVFLFSFIWARAVFLVPGLFPILGRTGSRLTLGYRARAWLPTMAFGSSRLRGQAGDPGGPIRNFQQTRPGPGRGLPGGRCGVPDMGSVTSRTPCPPYLVTVALSSGNHSQAQETPFLGGCWGSLRGSGSQETLLGPKTSYF